MKKKFFFIFIIILFILGIQKEVSANNIIFRVSINDDFSNSDYFYDGYVIYKCYDLEDANFVKIDYEANFDTICFCFSNYYIDMADDRYYSMYDTRINTLREIDSGSKVSSIYKCNNYLYLYVCEYVEVTYEEVGNSSVYIRELIPNKLDVELIKSTFYIEYTDEITTYGNLYDVYDYSIFNIRSVYDYNIDVYDDSYSNNYNKPGTYNVIYRIYDNNLNEEFKTLKIEVVYDSQNSPILIDNGVPDFIDITSPIDYNTLCSYVIAKDKFGNDITSKIVFNTNYDPKNLEINNYYLECTVLDDNYGAYYKKEFKVEDLTAPTISKSELNLSYTKCISIEDIINKLEVKDYSLYSYEVLNDLYSKSYNYIGKYKIVIRFSDLYSNVVENDIYINVIDDISPNVLVQDIKTTTSSMLSDDEILGKVIISDKTKCSVKLDRDLYDNNYNIIGDYQIKITVTDNNLNQTIKYINISVISDSNIKYYNNSIYIYNDRSLTEEELISFLRDISDNNYDENYVSTIESVYFKTPFVEGSYDINMTTTDEYGHEYKENYKIVVKKAIVVSTDKKNVKNRFNLFLKGLLIVFLKLIKLIIKFIF